MAIAAAEPDAMAVGTAVPDVVAVQAERVVSAPAAAGRSASVAAAWPAVVAAPRPAVVAAARPAVVAAADSPAADLASARRRGAATTAVLRPVLAAGSQCAHENRSKHSSISLDKPTR